MELTKSTSEHSHESVGRRLNLPGKYSLLIRTFWQIPILYTKLKCLLKKVTFWPNWIIPNTSLLLPEINILNKCHIEQVSWFSFSNTFSGGFFVPKLQDFSNQLSELTFNLQYLDAILPKAASISAELTHSGTSKIPVQECCSFHGTGSLHVHHKHNS